MSEEEEELRKVLEEETQLVIELDQNNGALTEEIKKNEERIEQKKYKLGFLDNKISILEGQQRSQELTVEEAQKYEADLKFYTQNLTKLEEKN